MKKQILPFLFVLSAILLISTSAYAQPTAPGKTDPSTRYANVGSTTSYTVNTTGTGTFTWAIRPKAGNTGTIPSLTVQTTKTQSVVWTGTKGGDVYYLDVYYKDGNGCYSEMLTYTVNITEAVLCIKTGTDEVINGITAKAPDVIQTCSLVATSPSGLATGNSTTGNSYGGDVTTFFLTIKNGVPNTNYSVTYTVGTTDQTPVTIATDGTGNGTLSVSVTNTDFPALFENTDANSKNVPITAKSMTEPSNPLVINSACTFNIAVNAKPAIAF
jgi:hypothetical protein